MRRCFRLRGDCCVGRASWPECSRGRVARRPYWSGCGGCEARRCSSWEGSRRASYCPSGRQATGCSTFVEENSRLLGSSMESTGAIRQAAAQNSSTGWLPQCPMAGASAASPSGERP